MPWRPFFRLLSSKVDRAGELRPRHRRGSRATPPACAVGRSSICFEVAFDDLVADSVAAGAQVLVVPDQQRDVRATPTDLPAAGDVAGARGRARPRRARVVTTSGVSAIDRPRRHRHGRDQHVHPRCAGRRNPARGHHYARRSAAGPPRVGAARDGTGRGRGGGRAARRPTGGGERSWLRPRRPGGSAGRPGAGGDPDLQRAGQPGAAARRGCTPRCPTRTCWSSTTAARTAPGSSPTSSPRTTRASGCCTAPAKAGLGAAYMAGFAGRWPAATRRRRDGRRRLARPGGAAALLAALDSGTAPTWCSGRARSRAAGSSTGRAYRKLISRGGNLYSRLALGVALRDITGGLPRRSAARCWRRSPLDEVASQGYCFQVDLAWRAVQAGFRVVEVPITFVERERGASKMSSGDRRGGVLEGHAVGAGAAVAAAAPPAARRHRLLSDGVEDPDRAVSTPSTRRKGPIPSGSGPSGSDVAAAVVLDRPLRRSRRAAPRAVPGAR